jgi:trk system potassium uptake protein TrkA
MTRRSRNNEYVVIGLGRFGSSLARELTQKGASVLGIDRDAELVQRYADQITETVTLDSTDEDALREVDVFSYKTVIVAIGNNFEASLITTSILKQHNVPSVIAKALTERQKDILQRMGADKVILPEHEAGQWLAHQLTHPGVIEYFGLGTKFVISEMNLPKEWSGKKIREVDLRVKCGATIVVVKRGESIEIVPPPGYELWEGDEIVVCGPNKAIEMISALE